MSESTNRIRKTSSFSLSDETFEKLDELCNFYEEDFGVRMSRSAIVERAVKKLFEDELEDNKDNL